MALHHAASGEVVHLQQAGGHGGQTIALVKSEAFEAIHLVLKSGETIPTHQIEGAMTLYCIEGAVAIDADGRAIEMRALDWLYLDPHVPHALRAMSDSALLLTILFEQPAETAPPQGGAT